MPHPSRQRGAYARMPAADRIWLGLDSPHTPMVVTAVLEFGEPVDWGQLRRVLTDRLLSTYPRFGQRIVPGRWPLRAPRWCDTQVDLDRHLQRMPDEMTLAAAVETLLSRPLDPTRPPWQCQLVATPTGDALVIRVHHCLADGIALAGVLLTLTDSESVRPRVGAAAPAPVRRGPAGVASTLGMGAGTAWHAVRLLTMRREPRTSLTGRLGTRRAAAWAPTMAFAEVKAVATATGASVNDVLLAVTAGALRRYLLAEGGEPRNLRVFVPVSVRPRGSPPTALGNRLGLLLPQLPVAEPKPLARVTAISGQMDVLKLTAEAGATAILIRLLGLFPEWAAALAGRILGAKATAIVTNVPGPRQPVRLAGAELARLTFWVPQVGSVGVGISILSYAGTVSIGVATDSGLVPNASRLTDAMTEEFAELRRAVELRPVP